MRHFAYLLFLSCALANAQGQSGPGAVVTFPSGATHELTNLTARYVFSGGIAHGKRPAEEDAALHLVLFAADGAGGDAHEKIVWRFSELRQIRIEQRALPFGPSPCGNDFGHPFVWHVLLRDGNTAIVNRSCFALLRPTGEASRVAKLKYFLWATKRVPVRWIEPKKWEPTVRLEWLELSSFKSNERTVTFHAPLELRFRE